MAPSTERELAIRLRIAIARLGRRMRVAAVGGLTPSQLPALKALLAEERGPDEPQAASTLASARR